jgi:hypothetical protein
MICELFKLARKNVKKTLKTEIESDSKGVEQICNLSCQETLFYPESVDIIRTGMNFRVEMTNPHVKEKSYKTFFSSLKFELILRANLKSLHIIYGLTRIAVVDCATTLKTEIDAAPQRTALP